jgi:exosortase/archaeosortase family protein
MIGLLSNSFRIAVLTIATSYGSGKGSPVFKFFHEDAGSLVFSGIAVFIFGWLYLTLLERELLAIESTNSPSSDA